MANVVISLSPFLVRSDLSKKHKQTPYNFHYSEDMNPNIDSSTLDGILVGRVDPQIYAFTTETIPNYLKVGDTYRPLQTRLDEWRKHYPNLIHKFNHSAKHRPKQFQVSVSSRGRRSPVPA